MSVINISNCKKCNLSKRPIHTNIVLGEGNPRSTIMLVGEAPGQTEALTGRPFVGKAGEALNELLSLSGLNREDLYITNVCKCWPYKKKETGKRAKPAIQYSISTEDMFQILEKNNIEETKDKVIDYGDKTNREPEKDEIRACIKYLEEEIESVKPKVIIPLGSTALHALTGKKEKITDRRGVPSLYGKTGSSSLYNKERIYIVPTLHPSFIQRNGGVWRSTEGGRSLTVIALQVLEDLKYAKNLAEDQISFKPHRYLCVDSREKVNKVINIIKKKRRFAFDIETTGLELWDKILGVGVAVDIGIAAYFPFLTSSVLEKNLTNFWEDKDITREEVISKLKEVFEDSTIYKSAHNAKFDMRGLLSNFGINTKGLFWDSMCGSYMKNENAKQELDILKNQYIDLLGYSDKWKIETKNGTKPYLASLTTIYNYCCGDCDATYRLTKDQIGIAKEQKFISKFMSSFYVPLMEFTSDFEYWGVKYDKEKARMLSKTFLKKEEELRKQIIEYANCGEFNPGSDQDLIKVFAILGLTHPKRSEKTGQPCMDADVMKDLSDHHIVPKLILERRHYEKMRSTYMEKYVERADKDSESRVHIPFNPIGAKTGRPSSRGLMNIPKDSTVKNLFIPEEGYIFVQGDLSQAEVRCFAHYANEDVLRDAFAIEGVDIHSMAAAEIAKIPYDEFVIKREDGDEKLDKLRSAAKSVIFGILYGRGAASIAKQNNWNKEQAVEFINNFFKKFPKCKEFIDATHELVHKTGEVVNIFGRVRRLPAIFSKDQEAVAYAERQSVNSIIQSTASDITIYALIKIHEHFKKQSIPAKIVLTVYDSIIAETREDYIDYVSNYMQEAMEFIPHPEFTVKLKADIEFFSKWGEKLVV